jgi:signal transduction histidine kinase
MRIVLSNLLGNALKFTVGVAAPRIELGCESDPVTGDVTYFVRDNGVGFDMRYAGKLFGVFQRLHDAAEFPGTGVGLATVKRIIARHGGRVWAQSRPGLGTTIFFTLSATPSDAAYPALPTTAA